jgi:hypothetical protein
MAPSQFLQNEAKILEPWPGSDSESATASTSPGTPDVVTVIFLAQGRSCFTVVFMFYVSILLLYLY